MRRVRGALSIVLLVCAAVVAIPGGAAAQTGNGELGPDYVRASASDLGAGTFPDGGLPARDPLGESPYIWARANDPRYCVVFADPWPPEIATHVTVRPFGSANGNPIPFGGLFGDHPTAWLLDDLALLPPDAQVVGPLVWDLGRSTAGGGNLIIVPWCPTPGTAPPWDAPTAAEIWEQTPLPRRAIGASPPGTHDWPGITRLATFFWSDARPPTTASVSLRGFDVTVVARPIGYAWSFGDGTTQIVGDPPSAIVPYFRRGDFDVTLYVVWEARAHMVYASWGVDLGDIDLGTVTLPEHLAYHVAEVRAVLRTTPTGR
jgi:PKD domain